MPLPPLQRSLPGRLESALALLAEKAVLALTALEGSLQAPQQITSLPASAGERVIPLVAEMLAGALVVV